MPWFDHHLHPFASDELTTEFIRESRAQGILGGLCNGTKESDWPLVQSLAKSSPWIQPALGLHPWFLSQRTPLWKDRLIQLLRKMTTAQLGEIGLDSVRHETPLETQKEILKEQLLLAQEYQRSATLHLVQAWEPLLQILEKLGPFTAGLIFHSYSGSAEMAIRLVRHGGFFSFSLQQFIKPSRKLLSALQVIPLNRLLLESDAPQEVTPQKKNTENPGWKKTTEQVARIWGVPLSYFEEQLWSNSLLLFPWIQKNKSSLSP